MKELKKMSNAMQKRITLPVQISAQRQREVYNMVYDLLNEEPNLFIGLKKLEVERTSLVKAQLDSDKHLVSYRDIMFRFDDNLACNNLKYEPVSSTVSFRLRSVEQEKLYQEYLNNRG